jgi:hypothetical protein
MQFIGNRYSPIQGYLNQFLEIMCERKIHLLMQKNGLQ